MSDGDSNGRADWVKAELHGVPPLEDLMEYMRAGGSGGLARAVAEAVEHRFGDILDRLAALEGPSAATGTARRSASQGGPATGALVRAWLQDEPPPRAWAVAGLVPEGAITTFFGDGASYKSLLAVLLGTVLPLGLDFLGRPVRAGSVLYLDWELDEREFLRRCFSVARGLELERPPEGLHYVRVDGALSSDRVQKAVGDIVRETGASVTILDSLTVAAMAADVKEASDMTPMLKAVETWGSVVALDHVVKPQPGANLSAYRPFGSVFKYNLSRSVVQVIRGDGGAVQLAQRKHNFGPNAPPLGVRVRFDGARTLFDVVDAGDPSLSGIEAQLSPLERVAAALERDGRAYPSELAEELGLSQSSVRNYLTALKRAGRAEDAGNGLWITIS